MRRQSKEVAVAVVIAGQAMQMARTETPVEMEIDMTDAPEGLNCTGTMTVEASEDGVWTMNGTLVSAFDLTQESTASGEYTCTVSGTIKSGTTTINEAFTYSENEYICSKTFTGSLLHLI